MPILSFHRQYFGIAEVDDPAVARAKVTERLLDSDPGLEDALPLIFDFLEVPDPDRPVLQMAPEVRMRRIFDVVQRVTARRSEREVLVLIFEDLHWFDPQSEAFLERLIQSFRGSRTLVVANFRPRFSAAWMRHASYRQLPLLPLREQAVGELLGGLLGVDLSLAPLVPFVVDRTAGNPFFVEEIVRVLMEDGTLAGGQGEYRLTRPLEEIRVPPSVQAVLAARIDRLSAEQKAVLQTASVIGPSFETAVLAEVSGSPPERLATALSALCAAELLQEADHDHANGYRFWHPLTQEVAYGSLLSDRRRSSHAAVAEALVGQNADHLDEVAGLLAWHWERAGRHREAARWNVRAGTWALRSDLAEAMRRWRGALELLDEAADREALELGVQTRIRLVQWGCRTGFDLEEAERLYVESRSRAERLGDPRLLTLTVMVFATALLGKGDVKGALELVREAYRLGASDPDLQAILPFGLAFVLAYTGPLSEALEMAERAVDGCDGDPERGVALLGYSALARAHTFRAEVLLRIGRLDDAKAAAEASLALARHRSEPEMTTSILAFFPKFHYMTGDASDQMPAATEAARIAEDSANVGFLVLALIGVGYAHLARGEVEHTIAVSERALAEVDAHGIHRWVEPEILGLLARAYLAGRRPDQARLFAERALSTARTQGSRVMECLAFLVRAEVQRMTESAAASVRADLDAALRLATATGARTYESFIHEELGRLHNDDKELGEALRLYRQIGATGHARRLEAELATKATS